MARPGSSASTISPVLVSGAPSGMKSPSWMCCSSGMIRLALGQFSGNSSLSTQRAVYQPARCQPICTSQGHTYSAARQWWWRDWSPLAGSARCRRQGVASPAPRGLSRTSGRAVSKQLPLGRRPPARRQCRRTRYGGNAAVPGPPDRLTPTEPRCVGHKHKSTLPQLAL